LVFLHQYAPYHSNLPKTLFARAKALGLEGPALSLLENRDMNYVNTVLPTLVNQQIQGLHDLASVKSGIGHILASVMANDDDNRDHMKFL